jgi:hypothetical protein
MESRLPIGLRNLSSDFKIMLYDPSYFTCNFKTSFVARDFGLDSERHFRFKWIGIFKPLFTPETAKKVLILPIAPLTESPNLLPFLLQPHISKMRL